MNVRARLIFVYGHCLILYCLFEAGTAGKGCGLTKIATSHHKTTRPGAERAKMCLIPRPPDADDSVGKEIEDEICDLLGGSKMVDYTIAYIFIYSTYFSIY